MNVHRFTLCGAPVDMLTREEACGVVERLLKKHHAMITTPNPEMLVLAERDERFRHILSQSTLAVPDGFGLTLAARLFGKSGLKRIPGTDFLLDIVRLAAIEQKKIVLLGGAEGVAIRAAKNLQKQFPSADITGISGGKITRHPNGTCELPTETLLALQELKPNVLFVALGHGSQESWIHNHLHTLPTVSIAMGVGGALDFIAGVIPRAPQWMRRVGFEWLYRFMQEPRRFPRIINAIPIFTFFVIRERLRSLFEARHTTNHSL